MEFGSLHGIAKKNFYKTKFVHSIENNYICNYPSNWANLQ